MRLVLHVGHSKMASSFVQAMLYANRDAFGAAGVAFPLDFRFCGGVDVGRPIRRGYVTAGNATLLTGYRPDARGFYESPARWSAFWDHLAGLDADTVILTSELIFYLAPERIGRIAEEVARRGFDVTIPVWLDRQDRLLIRDWAQNIRDNRFHDGPEEFLASRVFEYGDFPRVLDRWGAAFGQERVEARSFAHLEGGDIWTDFVEAARLPDLPGLVRPEPLNEGLPLAWIEALRGANRRGLPLVPFAARNLQKLLRPARGGNEIYARHYTPRLRDLLVARFTEANEVLLTGPYLARKGGEVWDYWSRFPDPLSRAGAR